MADHYFCDGTCKGVSHTPGTCQATECPLHGEELIPCDCEDGMHHKGEDEKNEDEEAG